MKGKRSREEKRAGRRRRGCHAGLIDSSGIITEWSCVCYCDGLCVCAEMGFSVSVCVYRCGNLQFIPVRGHEVHCLAVWRRCSVGAIRAVHLQSAATLRYVKDNQKKRRSICCLWLYQFCLYWYQRYGCNGRERLQSTSYGTKKCAWPLTTRFVWFDKSSECRKTHSLHPARIPLKTEIPAHFPVFHFVFTFRLSNLHPSTHLIYSMWML